MNQSIRLSFLLVLCCLSFLSEMEAQSQRSRIKRTAIHRFNAGIVLGLNVTQIDGDRFAGFDKFGILGGLKASMYLKKNLDFNVQLLYSQKGSRFETEGLAHNRMVKDRMIQLDYMEIPLLLSWKCYDPHKTTRGYVFDLGISYARLINSKITEKYVAPRRFSYASIIDDIKKDEFNFVTGLNYFLNSHFGVGVRMTVQMNLVYDNPNINAERTLPVGIVDINRQVPFLRNFLVTFNATYNIF